MEPDDASNGGVSWRGCSMEEIHRNLSRWELRHVLPVQPSDTHAVLYHFPIRNPNEPPKPLRQHEKWDSNHVRLPSSSHSQYPVNKSDGTVTIESRWELIRSAFARPIGDSRELERAILSYNSKYSKDWKFRALHKLFEEESTEEEKEAFFGNILPKIISLALRLPELVAAPIPLLKQGQNRSISLSQQQVSSLLANAFLCTFPRRNTMKRKSEYSTFPNINFSRLFTSTGPQVIEKVRCICHYFRRVCNSPPLGVITFSRRSLTEKDLPKWDECNAPLGITPLHVSSSGTIEDQGQGLLQVDFANKFLGGGVLGSGCVQEEIRFVICPELLVSKLFTEALKPCEALIMTGCEQFSKYTGYASTFTWAGNHIDETPMDESCRRQCNIAAIDALHFVQSSHQYREELIIRELNKAYAGFMHTLDTPAPGVASGNWGCGAFGGEATLKALIQLIVCTITKRPLVYFTFGNTELRDAIHDIHTFFIENNVTVKQLWTYLKAFHSHKLAPSDLYAFICQMHCDKQQDARVKASSSRMQRVITSTKGLLLETKKIFTTDINPRPNSFKKIKANVIQKVCEETLIVDVSDDEKESDDQDKANASSDLFSPESSPDGTCNGRKSGNSEPPTPSHESQASGSAPKTGSKFRQRSLLEMLDCDYNKSKDASAKRFKANDAIDNR